MALIDQVQQVCDRLALQGWRDLLLHHGLDITATDLQRELTKELSTIDRNLPGFTDFAADGIRGIEPGSPARSLLYHALASSAVHSVNNNSEAYPTLAELDVIENYIYSLANRSLADFPNAVIAVFAYQYRIAARSPHGIHADMAFSRTGVARVGTEVANYSAARRSFWVESDDGDRLAVMPARYAAFLAVERRPSIDDAILEEQSGDRTRQFLFPVHKLFPGDECLRDANITLEFLEYHRNEKLQRVHTRGGIPVLSGFDINKPPFVRDSHNSRDLVQLQSVNASVLLVPQPTPQLVYTSTQRNSVTGRDEIVRFQVPPENFNNRFWTSYQIAANGRGREAPEYVNMRHLVATSATGEQRLVDLNQEIASEDEFLRFLADGNYEAAHFSDNSCDGCISVKVNGLARNLAVRPAYSLVTAPDFFPLADQIAIERWVDNFLPTLRDQFSQGGPSPLSEGRQPPNPELLLPNSNAKAFQRNETAIAAIVSTAPRNTNPVASQLDSLVSFLPDAASNVFAPGWDVSLGQDNQGNFYAAYGLGSPFPEDAKLCAALNSFWPAVAPDAARTFGILSAPTALPLLDSELGYYPQHPRVKAAEVTSQKGWDGEYGPFFEDFDGLFVNFANKDRSDYISNALAGQIRVSGLAQVDSRELIQRMEALHFCIRVLPPNDTVSTTQLILVCAEKIADWSSRSDRAQSTLQGSGYLYVFATVQGSEQLTRDVRRKRLRVRNRFTCQITQDTLCWQQDDSEFRCVVNEPI
ncbi:hypothetical protein IQ230_21565 [Gloeocapsopsis crepidinum LEGE 06123]|uniref:Uncharacterized protein n=1 Tax=Gloeocapsopsis crepidinum LEGE 06123 TaxID=588587 RepID=A0ABR9UX93_9CHRO|nr:hypothetical protein [Gloeocapsopsis crepidinum]MBE9192894.1 hypothetical protein [Gloeocapsopsis crepidinum LEGE 06123]